MFGSKYFNHSEILFSSFSEMSQGTKNTKKIGGKILFLTKIYLLIFGIPEIGFQLRAMIFHKIIKDNLKISKFNKILDAGSGIGMYSFELAQKYPKAIVYGWDFDKNKIAFSNKLKKEFKLLNSKFEYTNILKNRKSENFDLIINIDVLEHIIDYKKVLKNFYFLLKPGGYLYLHTPQINQKRIFKRFEDWHHEDHVREGFAPSELRGELEKLGFKIIEMKETFGFFGKLAWELNHIALRKGFIFAGIVYPIVFPLLFVDSVNKRNSGLGIAVLAKK